MKNKFGFFCCKEYIYGTKQSTVYNYSNLEMVNCGVRVGSEMYIQWQERKGKLAKKTC